MENLQATDPLLDNSWSHDQFHVDDPSNFCERRDFISELTGGGGGGKEGEGRNFGIDTDGIDTDGINWMKRIR